MISNELLGYFGYLELHAYCAIILAVLLPTTIIYNKKRNKGTNRYIVAVYLFLFIMIISDFLLMLFQSKGIGDTNTLYFIRLCSYVGYSLGGFAWFLFCESEIGTILYNDKLIVALLSIPEVFALIIEVFNYFHRFLFTFDSAGNYYRMTGYYVIAVINIFYLVFGMAHSFYSSYVEKDVLLKIEYRIFAVVSVVFIIFCLTHLLTGISCLCIGAAGGIAINYQTITAGLNRREERRAKQREEFLKMDNESLALAVGTVYSMVFSINLTQNKYHVLGHDGEMALQIPADGIHDDLIRGGMMNIPDKKEREHFYGVLYRENQIVAYKKGKRLLKLRYREMGNDGFTHWMETVVIFVEGTEDITQITFVKNVDEEVRRESDIEEKKRKTEESAHSRNDYPAVMSRDIKTPINKIIGLTEMARLHMDDPVKYGDCLEKIDVASQHLLSLINDVTDINSIENGNITIKNEPMDLDKFNDSCVEILQGQLIGKTVELTHSFSVQHVKVLGDGDLLNKAVVNVIENIVKYNENDGRIDFDISESSYTNDKVRVKIKISNTGAGMSPEIVKHIWDPFSQENVGTRTDFNGSGLGMIITRRLVEMMQGMIFVDSNPDSGTTVTIDMTFAVDNSGSPAEKETVKDISGKRILLVEDSELNREIAKTLLEDLGMLVDTAEEGSKAVNLFEKSEPGYYDLILMDVMMPIMDGLTASRKIRSMSRKDAEKIAIVAMTANDNDDDIKRSISAGMNAHLNKPVDALQLKNVISKML